MFMYYTVPYAIQEPQYRRLDIDRKNRGFQQQFRRLDIYRKNSSFQQQYRRLDIDRKNRSFQQQYRRLDIDRKNRSFQQQYLRLDFDCKNRGFQQQYLRLDIERKNRGFQQQYRRLDIGRCSPISLLSVLAKHGLWSLCWNIIIQVTLKAIKGSRFPLYSNCSLLAASMNWYQHDWKQNCYFH